MDILSPLSCVTTIDIYADLVLLYVTLLYDIIFIAYPRLAQFIYKILDVLKESFMNILEPQTLNGQTFVLHQQILQGLEVDLFTLIRNAVH